jgi:hypothetical protein
MSPSPARRNKAAIFGRNGGLRKLRDGVQGRNYNRLLRHIWNYRSPSTFCANDESVSSNWRRSFAVQMINLLSSRSLLHSTPFVKRSDKCYKVFFDTRLFVKDQLPAIGLPRLRSYDN